MEPKTCPREHCGYTWTPRKSAPKKCPQCQGPLWTSPRPHKRHEGSSSVVERPSAKVPDEQSDGNAEGGSSVRIPASPHHPVDKSVTFQVEQNDSLSLQKARAEELIRMLS